MTRLKIPAILIVFLLSWYAGSLYAAEAGPMPPPMTETPLILKYKGFWGGVEAADITLTLRENVKEYQAQFQLASKGLIKKLFRFSASAENAGKIVNDSPVTSQFTSSVSKKKKERKYWWRLDPKTKIARVPDENNIDTEQTVSQDLRKNIYDPLSALIELRGLIHNAKTKDDWSTLKDKGLPVYDGRRRYDIFLQSVAAREEKIAGKMRKVIDVLLSIKPIAGFKDRDTDLWQNTKIQAFLSDDGDYLPLRIQASTPIAPVVIMLQGGL